jgi:hypothetical protein
MENPLETKVPNIAPAGDEAGRTPPSLTRLRTYKDDIAEAVKGNNMSAAKIFLAEEERRQRRERIEEATSPETPRNRVFLVASFLLVVVALAGFAFFRFFYRTPGPAPVAVDVPLFIRADKLVEIPAEERSYRDVQADLQKATNGLVPPREVHQITLSEAREATDGQNPAQQISSERLFGAIGAYPPAELTRSLAHDFFIGVYGSSKGPMPFVILETSNQTLARASMLAWEETMAADLASIFPRAFNYTRTTANQPTRRVTWTDAVYQNRDARLLGDGDTDILIWGFGDDGTIIITSDPFILPEMASRLTRDRELH